MAHLFVLTIPKEFVFGSEKVQNPSAPKVLQLDDLRTASNIKYEEDQGLKTTDALPRKASTDSFMAWQVRAEKYSHTKEVRPNWIEKVLDVSAFFINETQNSVVILSQLESVDGLTRQINFTSKLPTEKQLENLCRLGFGTVIGSIQVMPISISFNSQQEIKEDEEANQDESRFMASVKNREMIQTMVSAVYVQSQFSFDYLLMISSASVIAALGLAIGSDIILVASMLVSPMMGPIMGMCFGTVIYEKNLVLKSLRNEMLSILVCVVVGFISGIILVACANSLRGLSEAGFPTSQMFDRGLWGNLVIGIGIAIPSGIGAAISVTGSNTPGLVGVAISASLLPPAVNGGLLFAYAAFREPFDVRLGTDGDSEWDLVEMGIVSIILTLINVACILIFAILLFKIKEIAPLPGKSEFWSRIRETHKEQHEEDEESRLKRRQHIEELVRRKYPNFCVGNNVYDYSDTYLGDMLMAHPSLVVSRRGSLTGMFADPRSGSRRGSMYLNTLSHMSYIPEKKPLSINQIFNGDNGSVKSYQ